MEAFSPGRVTGEAPGNGDRSSIAGGAVRAVGSPGKSRLSGKRRLLESGPTIPINVRAAARRGRAGRPLVDESHGYSLMPSDDRTRGPLPRYPRSPGRADPGPRGEPAAAGVDAPELSVVVP